MNSSDPERYPLQTTAALVLVSLAACVVTWWLLSAPPTVRYVPRVAVTPPVAVVAPKPDTLVPAPADTARAGADSARARADSLRLHPSPPPADAVHIEASGANPLALPVVHEPPPATPGEIRLRACYDAVVKGLDARMRAALLRINGMPRKLLAVKYYLRHGRDIRSAWTWTPKEFAKYRKSPSYAQSLAEVEKVKAKFAELNPGYRLDPRTEVRTLDEQIQGWNAAPSVTVSGNGLYAALLAQVSDTAVWKELPDKGAVSRFIKLLAGAKVSIVPTVAVPGFSQHGQLRAYDFIIRQGDLLVASTEAGAIRAQWDKAGWTDKLHDAVTQASDRFVGPLQVPHEPWHYMYFR